MFLSDPCIQSVLAQNKVTSLRIDTNPLLRCETNRFLKNDLLEKLLERVVTVESKDKEVIFDISLRKLLEEFYRGFARAGIEFVPEGVDIKVIFKSSRCYAFSVDSFEIILDHVLSGNGDNNFAEVRSCYGDYVEAMMHLMSQKIVTRNPGEIRHGLFRYCLEIARGNHSDNMLYELIFTSQFYEEFGRMDITYFSAILSKFLLKHKKHWFCILTTMHFLLSVYSNQRSAEFLQEIVTQIFSQNST